MSNDPIEEQLVTHDELPETTETNPLDELPHDDEQTLVDEATSQLIDQDVASEDLSANDLINDGVPIEDIEPSNTGRRAMDNDFAHPQHEDTIEERIRQEVPEEGFDVVPSNPADPTQPGSAG